jgi:hypothetical protein
MHSPYAAFGVIGAPEKARPQGERNPDVGDVWIGGRVSVRGVVGRIPILTARRHWPHPEE